MKDLTEEQEKEIIRIYTEENRGQLYCAQKVLGVKNPKYVKDTLKKYGIHIRSYGEAAALSNKNRIKYPNKDVDFFKKESSDMAWILGFLASDGTIGKNSNQIKISLSIKDKEILEQIKKVIKLDEPIKEYTTNTGYDACTLQWTCEEHKKDLAQYFIVPAKTFILKPPYKLSRKYWIDYIRGYFDGDGSVNLIKNGNGRGNGNLRWQICGAQREVLEWIINFLYEEYNIPKVSILVRQTGQHPLYYFQYSSTSTRQIYNILYTPNSLFLKRKKDKYEEILQKVTPLNR